MYQLQQLDNFSIMTLLLHKREHNSKANYTLFTKNLKLTVHFLLFPDNRQIWQFHGVVFPKSYFNQHQAKLKINILFK
jgi:hypothetical protein